MKKKEQSKYLIIGLIVLVFLYLLNSQPTTQGTALSISNVQLTSDATIFDGDAIIVTFDQGSLDQQLIGSIANPNWSTKYDIDAAGSFKFESDFNKQKCSYEINRDATARKIEQFGVTSWECGVLITDNPTWSDGSNFVNNIVKPRLKNDGVNNTEDVVFAGYTGYTKGFNYNCYYVSKTESNTVGSLSDGYPQLSGLMKMSVADGSGSQSSDTYNFSTFIDSKSSHYFCKNGGNSCDANDANTFAYVSYEGNLQLSNCPSTSNYYAEYDQDIKEWHIIDKGAYTTYSEDVPPIIKALNTSYKAKRVNGVGIAISCPSNGCNNNEVSYLLDKVKSANNIALSAETDANLTKGTTYGNTTSLNNGYLLIPTTKKLANPVFTLYIKAASIGINTLVPKTEFVSLGSTSDCITTGETGQIPITLKNTGKGDATVEVSGTCGSGFLITNQILNPDLKAGAQETYYINYNVDVPKDTNSSCSFTLYDQFTSITKSAKVCGLHTSAACTNLGKQFCGNDGTNDVIYSCSSDGLTKSSYQTCSSSEYCDSDTVTCKSKDDKEESTVDCDVWYSFLYSDCKSTSSDLDNALIYGVLIGLGVAMFTYLLLMKQFPPTKANKELKYIFILLSGVVGFFGYKISSVIIEHWIISLIVVIIVGFFVYEANRFIPNTNKIFKR